MLVVLKKLMFFLLIGIFIGLVLFVLNVEVEELVVKFKKVDIIVYRGVLGYVFENMMVVFEKVF